MDVSGILWAGLIGAAAGAVGVVSGLLFPRRVRPVVAVSVIALAFSATDTIRTYAQTETMTPESFERGVMEELQSTNKPVYRIMLLYKEHEPDLFHAMMEKMRSAVESGKSTDEGANIARDEIGRYTASRIGQLSDEGILTFTDLTAKQFEQLAAEKKDALCLKMARSEPLGAVEWSTEMTELEYQMVKNMLTDRGGSGESADQQTVQQAATTAMTELMEAHGQEKVATAFERVGSGGPAPDGFCAVFGEYFRLLKKAGGPQAAQIMRAIYTSG